MKKVITLLSFSLFTSLLVYSQNLRQFHESKGNSIDLRQEIPADILQSNILSNKDGLIQLFDSIINFKYINDHWSITSRETEIIYNNELEMTSSIVQSFKNGSWVDSLKYTRSYDTFHNNIGVLVEKNIDGIWTNYNRFSMEYDDYANVTYYLSEKWHNAEWQYVQRYSYSFNATNHITRNTFEWWTGINWRIVSDSEYSYDANNNLVEYTQKMWNGTITDYISRLENTYDNNHNLLSSTGFNWDGSGWINSHFTSYSYAEDHQLDTVLTRKWEINAWVDNLRQIYTWENNDNTEIITELFVDEDWTSASKLVYGYDSEHRLVTELSQKYENGEWINEYFNTAEYNSLGNRIFINVNYWLNSNWVRIARFTEDYDANHFLISRSDVNWNLENPSIGHGDSTHYYYEAILGINESLYSETEISVYPNPSNGNFEIKSNQYVSEVKIYSLCGELITCYLNSGQGNNQFHFKLTSCPTGLYIFKAIADHETFTGKLLISH